MAPFLRLLIVSALIFQIAWVCVFCCAGAVSIDGVVLFLRCLQCSLFFFSSPVFVWSNNYGTINPVLSIPKAITACPKLPESLICGEFTSSHCMTAGSTMGPYFLFITANWIWGDSSKSFSGTIDQQWAICLSFLIGDINVAPCLLKSPVTKNVEIGRVQEFVQRWGRRRCQARTRLIWPGLAARQQIVLTSHTNMRTVTKHLI